MTKKKGRPATIADRVIISHGIPRKLLTELDNLAEFPITRTEIINKFIIDGLKKGKAV